ncbi:phenylalanine--tRNA ligase subunit alpha [Candidatus Woesearchaeota archaeon CG10_big_fil_rev_8_21_14_0_10_44_13]|nr:MAG: phenylalanine--tRNA ligase subunit alpha [Candidatus Woesearchaeota archaeon CG10_big_fil_rev_8_21_14_0_10_44_13]
MGVIEAQLQIKSFLNMPLIVRFMANDAKALVEGLHPLERKVLPYIIEKAPLSEIVKKSRLKDIEVMRALQWLENKKLVEKTTSTKDIIRLDANGEEYSRKGMPERRLLEAIKDSKLSFEDAQKKAKISREEFNVCLGVLKKKAAVSVEGNEIKILNNGINALGKKSLEETFIEKLLKEKDAETGSLHPEEKFAYENLKRRKGIIKEDIAKTITASLTDEGKEVRSLLVKTTGKEVFIDRITPEMLKDGSWKKGKVRKYDVRINVPQIYGGRRHFVNQAIEYIKTVWLDMGFREMKGAMLDTSFWNFDALFTAQDHPVRELQDTFYIKNPEKGRLPEKRFVDAVKSMHENGGGTGSSGWGYRWNPEEAKKNVLRTHTTVLSAHTLAKLKDSDMPAKFFSVARCFRNEALDWSHLFELHQIEGIVVDPDANFKNLVGYLKEFFKKLGYDKVRVRPAYFPYTEPSAEVEVFHPVKKRWVELAGAGIFRPEVVVPLLGKDVPVLAWGMGLERSIAEYFSINDIRQVYNNNLKMLRGIKMWGK